MGELGGQDGRASRVTRWYRTRSRVGVYEADWSGLQQPGAVWPSERVSAVTSLKVHLWFRPFQSCDMCYNTLLLRQITRAPLTRTTF